jgi:GTP-binding protein HflX
VVLTDTVGFIRDMPKDLFAAFRATFEEIADADLLLEVLDGSNAERDDHVETTERLLAELELDRIPRLRVFSKADLLPEEERRRLELEPRSTAFSALDQRSIEALLDRLAAILPSSTPRHREPDVVSDFP